MVVLFAKDSSFPAYGTIYYIPVALLNACAFLWPTKCGQKFVSLLILRTSASFIMLSFLPATMTSNVQIKKTIFKMGKIKFQNIARIPLK